MMKKQLISLQISIASFKQVIDEIIILATKKQSAYVCIANVHMLVEAHNDAAFADIVNSADMVTPDGMPLAKSIKWLYGIKQDRVAGMDVLPAVIEEAISKNLPVFFYGGSSQMLERTKAYIDTIYPQLQVGGMISPPFRPLTTEETEQDIAAINQSGAQIVFVVLGCPKQEKWMHSMRGRIHAVMLGIGGALPVMVGMQKRAPVWVQKSSLEWLYRLCQEPRRLFKRYATTNTVFMWLLGKALLQKMFTRKSTGTH
ncbi:WecB/TagA/CpsF family glycosyltransferase [Limnovirga soli]|uniref:WecB/TagA/CpsF family glycosyltransferase n=1 Tax=Limnovirga soli TaxID=2656915 RepID=A0A8J8FCD9_9BACT|nr:WecB/TagA/CpsF family glycosyltransferase [Limnovirga soli]NNV54912.1 WecB/TagA/CpsF family glycosyltransferase [Limnovirga soli]